MYIPAQLDMMRKFFGVEIIDYNLAHPWSESLSRDLTEEEVVRNFTRERRRILRTKKKQTRNEKHSKDKIISRSAFSLPSEIWQALGHSQIHRKKDNHLCESLTLMHSHPLRALLPCSNDPRSLRVVSDIRRSLPADPRDPSRKRVMHEMIDAGHELRLHLWVPAGRAQFMPDVSDDIPAEDLAVYAT